MRLAWRIAAGPKRAPGRLEVARSNGMPAMTIAASRSLRSRPRKLGRVAKVGMLVMAPIWGGRDRLLREGTLTGRRAAVGKPAPFASGERGGRRQTGLTRIAPRPRLRSRGAPAGAGAARAQTRSRITVMPWQTPTHIVTSA